MSARCFGVCSDISIHAPTRGATDMNPDNDQIIHNFNPRSHERSDHERISQFKLLAYFNPRSHERSDNLSGFQPILLLLFQSTLPREERPQPCTVEVFSLNFNPRSHERSDSNIAQKICLFLYNTDNKYIIR